MIQVPMRLKNDCFKCCVASILELPYEEVPHFFDYEAPDPNIGFRYLERWLHERKQWPLFMSLVPVQARPEWDYHIVLGPARGRIDADEVHAVVHIGSGLCFDPRAGGKGVGVYPDRTNAYLFICAGGV